MIKIWNEPNKIFQLMKSLVEESFSYDFISSVSLIEKHKSFPELSEQNCFLFSYTVEKKHCNFMGNMHGGAISTLIDEMTSCVLCINDRDLRQHVSIKLDISFMKACFEGEELFLLTKTDKIGRKLGYSSCKIYNKKLEPLVVGSHIKCFLKPLVSQPKL